VLLEHVRGPGEGGVRVADGLDEVRGHVAGHVVVNAGLAGLGRLTEIDDRR
jgi:hypothetical protein